MYEIAVFKNNICSNFVLEPARRSEHFRGEGTKIRNYSGMPIIQSGSSYLFDTKDVFLICQKHYKLVDSVV